MYEVLFYAHDDDCPVRSFLDGLPAKPRAKVLRFISHLSTLGPDLPRPYADALRDKIRELRVPYGRLQIRLLYFFAGKRVVLTQGFLKKTSAVSAEEIERALRRMDAWLDREG